MGKRLLFSLLAAGVASTTACDDSTGVASADSVIGVKAIGGVNQTAVVGESLAEPLRVRVAGPLASGLANAEVQFEIASGGGELTSADGTVGSSISVIADQRGFAEAGWTLGPRAGRQGVTAIYRPAGGRAIAAGFSATALAGPPIPTTVNTGAVLASAGDRLTLSVRLEDAFSNPIRDTVVNWELTQGEGTFRSTTAVTDEQGVARGEVTPSAAGAVTVAALLANEPIATSSLFAVTALATDPAGDTFSPPTGRIAPDILTMGAWIDPHDTLHVHLEFRQAVVADGSGAANEVLGVLEFDTDQDPGTGGRSVVELLSGTVDLGVEYLVVIGATASGDFEVISFDGSFEVAGSITPVFSDRLLTLSIPLGLIAESDSKVDMGVFVGTPNGPGSSRRVAASWIRDSETIAVLDIAPDLSPLSLE